ncbi:MAG: hypothetical protein RIN53_11905 [Gammaproteobacteria bacterium]
MGRHHDAGAKVGNRFAAMAVDLEYRRHRIAVAVNARPPGRPRAAALVGDHVTIGRVDIDPRRGTPGPPGGQLSPLGVDLRDGVGEALAGDDIAGLAQDRARQGCQAADADQSE